MLAEGRVTNYELTIRAKDGKETVVSYNATTFRGQDGRLRGVFAAARDVTAQKHLEEQLRQAQNYNRGLIESSVDAMLTVDPDLVITDVNEQMAKLTGYSREQLIGSAFQDYFTEPDRAAAGVGKTLSEGFVTNYELTLRSRYRREILVSFNASVFKDTEGNVRGIFAVARDVTEQRRLEEQLREQQNYNRGLILGDQLRARPQGALRQAHGRLVQRGHVQGHRGQGGGHPRRRPRHHGAEAARGAAPRPAELQPEPDRVVGGRAHDRGPDRRHHRRERADREARRLQQKAARREPVRRLLHGPGPRRRRRPQDLRGGCRHQLRAGGARQDRAQDPRVVQRLGLPRRVR
ncbi:MAG: PAS domain S-box protein [Candidatus Rokubacteria bacterium]|nr:PAS domain S-box protein [Candidatus Rokubacteria bacterium]